MKKIVTVLLLLALPVAAQTPAPPTGAQYLQQQLSIKDGIIVQLLDENAALRAEVAKLKPVPIKKEEPKK